MQKTLGKEISNIVEALKKEGKRALAKEIEENWSLSLLEYSKKLNSYKPRKALDPLMREALKEELKRLNYPQKTIEGIISFFSKRRFLQTSPHLSPSQKPRFFFINYLTSLALNKKEYFAVAMFSGIPFSNKTRPGRICSKNGEINLMPKTMQNALVYKSQIPSRMVEVLEGLDEKGKFPKAKTGDSYTSWAIHSTVNLEKKYTNGIPVYFDFNEVATRYLSSSLKKRSHVLQTLLFDPKEAEKLEKLFANEIFFYAPIKNGKYDEMQGFYLKNGVLDSGKERIKLTKENLLNKIEKNRLCVGLPFGFLIFSFFNNFLCGGSFAQTEYLPIYREKFSKIPCLGEYKINNAPAGALTTGGFSGHADLHPLDLAMGEKIDLQQYKNTLFGESLVAIKNVLLHQNYSHNMIK